MSGDGVGYEPLKDEDSKSPEPVEVASPQPMQGRPTLAFQKGRDDAAAAKGEQLVLKAAEGDLEAVSQLLLRDADINYATKKGKYTALIKACRMKRVDVAKFLIDQGAAVNFASQNGWTSLIEASRVGCAELVELLLQKEADVEATNRMGWTALVEACRNAHFNVVKLLIEKGHALVGHIDKDGLIALEHTSAPLKNIRDFLSAALAEERRQGRSAPPPDLPLTPGEIFAEAAGRGELDVVKKMLESGEVDVNSVNRNGKYTALTLACRNQRVDVAKYLVEKGADMNKKSTTGWTCLIEAARVGNPELIVYLTDKSRPGFARINDTNDFGWPPLIEACRNSYFKCVKLLLELGADPSIEDGDGEPPLEHTSQPWIVALLEDKLHAGSPRSRLLAFLEESKNWNPVVQMAKFLELVDDAFAQTQADKQMDVAFIIAQTLVQERNVALLAAVLQRDVFQSALCTHKQNIIHSIVQLPPPEDDRGGRTALPAFAKQAHELCAVMKVILDSLFGDNFEAAQLFLSPPKGISASLQCAMNYSAILEKKASDLEKDPREGLPALAHYYALMLNNLMLLGSRLGDVDGNKATAVHHMLRLIPTLSKLSDLCPVNELILHWRTIWRTMTEPIPELPDRTPATYGLTSSLLNKRDGAGRPAIVYLIMLSEVPDREDVLLGFMEYGAQFPEIIPDAPDFKMERNRLITILGDIMQDNPESSWRIMRNAVKNNDTALVDAVIQRKLPVYMVNPRLSLLSQRNRRRASQLAEEGEQSDHETSDKPPLTKMKSDGTALSLPFDDTFGFVQDGQKKRRWAAPSADLGRLEECLLHMLVELENKSLFAKMLEYSERPSSKAPKNEKYPSLRWPWPIDGINGAIQWRNSFGMNIFHIIARKKLAMPSKKNTELFQQLLAKDLHAMVARSDNYGWSPIHYAAYTNKLDIITELIRSNIDIGQITSGVHQFDYEQTSLHIASEQGNWAVSLALCKAGAMVDDIDKNGCTPLALAMLARQKYLEKKESYEKKVAAGQADQVLAGDHPDIVVINARCVADIAFTDPALLAFVQEATNKDKQRRASKAAGLGATSATSGEARIDIGSDTDTAVLPPLPPLPSPPPAAKQPAVKRVGTTRHTGNTLPRVRAPDAAAALALSAGPVMEMKNSSSSEDESPSARAIPKVPPAPPGSLTLTDYFNTNVPDYVLRYIDELPLEFSEWADKYYENAKREFDATQNTADQADNQPKKGGHTRAHERGPSRMPTTEIIDRTVLYNMTIEALLNHEASIATASSSSGKTLYELMNVDEKWDLLSTEIETLRHQKSVLEDEYYDSLYQDVEVTEMVGGQKKTSKRPLTLEERRAKKDDIDLQLLVLETRAGEVFLNKESQMVINQYYDEKIRMRSYLKLIRYGIFLTLITVLGIMQTTRDTQSAYYLNLGLQAGLVNDDFDASLSPIPKQFASITNNPDEIYMWLQSIVIPAFYSDSPQYWDGINQIAMRNGLLFEGHNIVVGVPRLRTVRARKLDSCDQPVSFSGLSKICFSRTEEETRDWTVATSSFTNLKWRTESDTGATSVWGRVYVIPGSGYTVDFPALDPANSAAATTLVQELKAARFVDAGTRALMLEFTVFNPHENHFAVGTMYLEFPLGGGIINSSDFFVTKLRRTVASYDRVLNALAIIVLLLVLLHTFSESQQILSSRNCAYFASAYNWADMAIIVFSPCIFGLWIAEYVIETETDWTAVDSFVPVARMARLNYVQNIFWSILILISWGKLFDYLSVFHKLYRMIIIIETSAGRLNHIFIVFAIVLAGFTSAEYVAYGYLDSTSFTWLWGFLNRYIAIFSGGPVLFAHTDVARILGTIYVCLYVLIFTVLLLNLIIAILTSGYEDAIHASSDTMARRQYFKMQSEGLTKNVAEEEEEQEDDVNSRLDSVLLDRIDEVYTKVDDWLDRKVFGRLYTTEIEDFVPTETIKLIQAKAKELQKQAQIAGSAVGGVGSAVAHGVVMVGTTVGRGVVTAGTTVGRGVVTAGTAVVNVAASAGNAVVNVGQTMASAFHLSSPRAAAAPARAPAVPARDPNEAKQQ